MKISESVRRRSIEYLRESFGFEEDVAAGLLEKLERDVVNCLAKLSICFNEKQAEQACTELHALKGILGNAGAAAEADLAAELETLLRNQPQWQELEGRRATFYKALCGE